MSVKAFFKFQEKEYWSLHERIFKLSKYKRGYKKVVIQDLMEKHGWSYRFDRKAVYKSMMSELMDIWLSLSLHDSPENYEEVVEAEVQEKNDGQRII